MVRRLGPTLLPAPPIYSDVVPDTVSTTAQATRTIAATASADPSIAATAEAQRTISQTTER